MTQDNKNTGTVVAFQNMLTINIEEIKKFGTSNIVRVGLYSRSNPKLNAVFQKAYGLIDKNASPFCSDDALLELQPPRENFLAFLAEEYGRSSGKEFTSKKSFDFKLLGNQILGQVKAWRALMGFRTVGSALMPKGGPVKTGYYLEFSLPEVQLATAKLKGVIQGLNSKVYDVQNMQQEYACAVPESIITSCFTTPKTLQKKAYNPLSNEVLNLGKNLFDFESMIHVGYTSDKDRNAWENSVSRFLSLSNKVNPTKHTGFEAPTFEETLKVFPQFEEVWAVSMHKLELSGPQLAPISGLNAAEKAKQDSKTVQYALYSNNNTTRILQTNSISVAPNIKSFDLPNLYTNFSIQEIKQLQSVLEGKASLTPALKAKVCEALAYYRYINQSFIPVGKEVNLEVLMKDKGTEKAKGIATSLEKQTSNSQQGFEMDLGGSFALNLFEKNARIMGQGASRTDALNFVADDNAKFMDVRLPPAYYKVGESLKKMPVDYALAYSTNSNVVLLARTVDNPALTAFKPEEFAKLWKAFNANTDFKALRYNFEAKNPPLSGVWSSIKKGVKAAGRGVTSAAKTVGKGVTSAAKTVGKGVVSAAEKTGSAVKRTIVGREAYKLKYPGLTWADKVVISRPQVTPSRLILDAFYQMMNSYLNLYGKFYAAGGYNKTDLLDPYEAAIFEGLLNPEYPLFKTPFNLFGNRKFVNYVNALRGVLFNPDTMFTSRDFKKGTKNIKKSYSDLQVLKGTKEFLAAVPSGVTLKLSSGTFQITKPEVPAIIKKVANQRLGSKTKTRSNPAAKAPEKKLSKNLAMKAFLVDASFFSNVASKTNPTPRFIPFTSGNTKHPKLNPIYDSKYPTDDGEYVRNLPNITKTLQSERMTADSSTLHNLPALVPFIKDGSKFWGATKKQNLLPCITPKVFHPFRDKKQILDAIVFYHRAATNCGSLLCNSDLGKMKEDVSVFTNVFLINPYTGDLLPKSQIISDVGLGGHKVRMFESTVQLRKEYYGIRLLALLGSYFSRAFDTNAFKPTPVSAGPNKGFILYEEVFGQMVNYMLKDFSDLSDENSKSSLDYLLSFFDKKGKTPKNLEETGILFTKFVLAETEPFTKIIKETFGKLENYKYADSKAELLLKCSSDSNVDNELKDKDLLAFIVDSQKFRDIDEGTISEEAYELARRFYCSKTPEGREELKRAAVKMGIGKTQATIAMLNPDIIQLDEETKQMMCSQVGRMRIMDVKSGDAFVQKLKELYHNSDEEFRAALQKMACDKISVQTNIQKAEEEQQVRIATLKQEAEIVAQQEDLIAEQQETNTNQGEGSLIPLEEQQAQTQEGVDVPTAKSEKDEGLPWGWIAASVIGLGAVSYVGYKMYTNKENR